MPSGWMLGVWPVGKPQRDGRLVHGDSKRRGVTKSPKPLRRRRRK